VNWLETIAAELPAPRDDEPPDLRRRIVAELADHLQLAFVRELHLVRDETKARERVLARFGDPRRIARKLWFEAMREKIMSQRLLVASSAVTTALCLAMGLFLWRISAQSAEASRALIQETREMNQALIEKLGALAAPGVPQQSADMVHLTIRLVQKTPNGAAAAGYAVHVRRPGPTDSPEVASSNIEDRSGSDGTVDCGLVRFGNYIADITTPWKQSAHINFYVRAGRTEQVETIVCPKGPPVDDFVSLAFDVPADLRDRELRLVVEIRLLPHELRGISWNNYGQSEKGIISPDGTFYGYGGWGLLSKNAGGGLQRWQFTLNGNARSRLRIPEPWTIRLTGVGIVTKRVRSETEPEEPLSEDLVVVPAQSENVARSDTTVGERVNFALEEVWDQVHKALARYDAAQATAIDDSTSEAAQDDDRPRDAAGEN